VGTIVGSVFRCLNLLCCVTLVCVWFASCFAVHGFGYRLDRLHARAMALTTRQPFAKGSRGTGGG
jgi:hypothetical protein